jgi:HEPN domain-containing protein
MWGFHAQQVVEKLIKALLSYRQIGYPMTHRLRELGDLAERAGVPLDVKFESLLDLTPYAAELRYAMLPRSEDETRLTALPYCRLLNCFASTYLPSWVRRK